MIPKIIFIEGKIFGRFVGFALYPWLVISKRARDLPVILNHELIHWYHQAELWYVGFWVLYLYYNVKYGYANNPFEFEAYVNEDDWEYLDHRPKNNWRRYIKYVKF